MDSMFRQRLNDLEACTPDIEFFELVRAYDARAGPGRVDEEKADKPKTNNREVNNDGMEKEFPTAQTAAATNSTTELEAWPNALNRRA